MTIEKLPSGSYRATIMQNGKRYRRTFDHKPTQKEVLQALSDELNAKPKIGLTFAEAAAKYCEMKSNVLSPSTLRDYIAYPHRLPEWFSDMQIDNIDQIALNRVVNELTLNRSPKTVRNYHGFISAILSTFRPDLNISTHLPQKRKKEPYIPSVEELKAILDRLRGTEYEVAILLASYGMRRSEICALLPEDIEGTTIHINKALVLNSQNEWVVRNINKSTEGTRDIIVPQYIVDRIHEQGYVYKGYPTSITQRITELEKKLGIQHFSMHKLRHYFASRMAALGVPEADILHLGGWKSDHVMKSVYRHSMIDRDHRAKQAASDKLAAELFSE